jgi:hypothetical protein
MNKEIQAYNNSPAGEEKEICNGVRAIRPEIITGRSHGATRYD